MEIIFVIASRGGGVFKILIKLEGNDEKKGEIYCLWPNLYFYFAKY